MQVKHTNPKDTEAVITVVASTEELLKIKENVLNSLAKNLKITGFRPGKAPLNLVEKQVDQNVLQSEFLDQAINQIYPQAVNSEKLRPVGNPNITVKKFVPFDSLEFEATVQIVGKITLPDYKNIDIQKDKVSVTAKDVDEVLVSLQKRMGEKKDVDRKSKQGDQVWIDFSGNDKDGKPVSGADGKDYPLVLGSKTFIPGFEENLEGLKAGDEKTFTVTFPKDYGVKALANKEVTFTVTLLKVQEVVEPKIDDDFAKKAGPFTDLKTLKDDIKKQLSLEKENQIEREYESKIVEEITEKAKVSIPDSLIDEQKEIMLREFKQNLAYRGQTYNEYLEMQGFTEDDLIKNEVLPEARKRVKASLILTEISEIEKIDVSMDEINDRKTALKSQYQDQAMRDELDKPENLNNIASRIVTEKTLAKLKTYIKK
jgi:trigger factor